MTAPDPILEVVAQALHGDECPDDPDYGDPCRCDPTSYDREAEVAVAAARPLIEAEVREAVAREIEARIADLEAERADKLQGYELHQRDGALEALRDVLTSLRGGDQW